MKQQNFITLLMYQFHIIHLEEMAGYKDTLLIPLTS